MKTLEYIGLTKSQAATYKQLVTNGKSTAPELAIVLHESRTNIYKLLDKLVELGLATKNEVNKKLCYIPTSPAALERLVHEQLKIIQNRERRLNTELPELINYYFEHSERPSIRYYEGVEGLTKIAKDQLITNKTVKFIRGSYDYNLMSFGELHKMRNMFPRLGIQRETIIQDVLPRELPPNERMSVEESDKAMLLRRTWITQADYSAPVEWAVYGSKLSIVQYGEQAMGMVIESAPIADAFRQIYSLLNEGIRRRPNYSSLPKVATYTAIPEAVKSKAK